MSPYMKVMKPDRNFQMQNQFRQPNFLGIRLSLEIRRLKSRCRNIRARHPFPVLICFGNNMDDSHLDLTAGDLINRISFQASQDISSLKNMAGETGKKLTSIVSSLINDLQDRIL